ncbi:nucleotidyltransferase domain-containing protein [bacterium]|nr:nucleotidyltransferase domain-containing protein [bacterium]MBU1152640.1 nucleotidyltransferase domain-containing protein [bacterium]MBU1782885.1 nucleotidyltransferase domain-containing protein [bacterium]MBU2600436.1 nucleotidyltransferase domain-containing protein [bacterium]
MKDTLSEITNRIVDEIAPDKIILFGSRGKDGGTQDSDYDICILKSGVENRRVLEKRIYRRLFGVGAAVDVIIETPEKFKELKDKWFLVHSEIAKFGRVVYER